MILKQGHKYLPMPHDGKLIAYIYRGGRCYYIASPYSPEATQALKAAFPQYWTAIRDYGYAHPQLVPFINEDPMLIVSLVEVGKTRWLVGDGKAYVDTGFIANNYTTSYMYRVVWYTKQSSGGSIIGTISNNAGFGQIFMNGSVSNLWGGVGNTNTGLDYSLELGARYDDTVTVNISGGTITRTTNGVTKSKTHNVSVRPTASAFLYAYNTGTTANQNTKCSFAMCLLYGDDQPIREMYPFIRNGENGMLDILSGTFYPNANTQGAFTIQITDKA